MSVKYKKRYEFLNGPKVKKSVFLFEIYLISCVCLIKISIITYVRLQYMYLTIKVVKYMCVYNLSIQSNNI